MSKIEEKAGKFFDEADTDGSGCLSRLELCKVLKKLGFKLDTAEVSGWFDEVDFNKDDKISKPEFLKALTKRPRSEVQEAELRESFKKFDTDGSGYISKAELEAIIKQQGVKLSSEQLDKVIDQVDKNNDDKINFEEFLAAWHKV